MGYKILRWAALVVGIPIAIVFVILALAFFFLIVTVDDCIRFMFYRLFYRKTWKEKWKRYQDDVMTTG
jgi:Na+-driven multidrug efflux pump